MNKIINDLPAVEVSLSSTLQYEKNSSKMLEQLNILMLDINEKEHLIGDNSISLMEENHKHHAKFMVNVFKLNDYKMLKKTIQWVFHSYESKGFKSNYFQRELECWIKVINENLDSEDSKNIIIVYEWMKNIQLDLERTLFKPNYTKDMLNDETKNNINILTNLLLSGDSKKTLNFANEIVKNKTDLENFYTNIVTYSMYDVGEQWEKGIISVAQEHLATSIVMRIMSSLYMNLNIFSETKGKAVVTASVNEYHELGARIVADIFELDGWDVKYLGSNVPDDELIKILKEEKADILSISVTMVFNIDNVVNLINKIRNDKQLAGIKIIVGGYAFNTGVTLTNSIEADYIASNIDDSVKMAREWWKNNNVS